MVLASRKRHGYPTALRPRQRIAQENLRQSRAVDLFDVSAAAHDMHTPQLRLRLSCRESFDALLVVCAGLAHAHDFHAGDFRAVGKRSSSSGANRNSSGDIPGLLLQFAPHARGKIDAGPENVAGDRGAGGKIDRSGIRGMGGISPSRKGGRPTIVARPSKAIAHARIRESKSRQARKAFVIDLENKRRAAPSHHLSRFHKIVAPRQQTRPSNRLGSAALRASQWSAISPALSSANRPAPRLGRGNQFRDLENARARIAHISDRALRDDDADPRSWPIEARLSRPRIAAK